MKIFGFEFPRQKKDAGYSYVDSGRGWYPLTVNEPYTGAWQRNERLPLDTVLANSTVFRCTNLIADDIAKLPFRLVKDNNGIWQEIESPAFSPVIRKPNDYQNRIQFYQHWMLSKLTTGNAYVLKGRDNRGVVNALYVLDPHRTKPLVAPDGAVFYELRRDDLSGQHVDTITVPAREIIHDRMNAMFHPLCGLSPIFANNLPASQSIRIQRYSDKFFGNAARPSGVLTAPGIINKETAERLKAHWEQNYTAENAGKVAVLGDGLKFDILTQNAVDSQLIEQLHISDEKICTTYGIPAYKVGVAPPPAFDNIEAQDQQYYSNCLQIHIESIELLLDEGLELPTGYGTEFDLDGLLRMDTPRLVASIAQAVGAGVMAPNEGRKKLGLMPAEGGDTPYLQQQNYSLAALNKRDTGPDPFSQDTPAPTPAPSNDNAAQAAAALVEIYRGLHVGL